MQVLLLGLCCLLEPLLADDERATPEEEPAAAAGCPVERSGVFWRRDSGQWSAVWSVWGGDGIERGQEGAAFLLLWAIDHSL